MHLRAVLSLYVLCGCVGLASCGDSKAHEAQLAQTGEYLDRQQAGIAQEISELRRRYALINGQIDGYRTVERHVGGLAVEGAKLTAYVDGEEVKKVVMRYFAESGYAIEEYYFRDGDLFFLFRSKRRANQWCGCTEGVAENRYYFRGDTLIRWIDDHQHLVVTQQEAAERERQAILQRSSEFLALAREAVDGHTAGP